jgi:hypothetical protein
MKKHLPGKVELALLLAMIGICALLVMLTPKFEIGMAVLSVPISIAAGLMGLRRNWKLQEVRQEIPTQRSADSSSLRD